MALAVSPPSRVLLWLGIAFSISITTLWAITRTLGVPLGPMAGMVLPVGLLDGLAQLLEALQVVHLAVLLRSFDQLGGRALIE
jgi:hypothetical protein